MSFGRPEQPAAPTGSPIDWAPFVQFVQACLKDCKNGAELTDEQVQQRLAEISALGHGPKPKSPQTSSSGTDAEVSKAARTVRSLRHKAAELDAALHRRSREIRRVARDLQVINMRELPEAIAELEAAQAKQRAQADSVQESALAAAQPAAVSPKADVPPLVEQTKEVLVASGIHSDGISDPSATSSAMGEAARRPHDDVDEGATPAKARRSSLPSAAADRSEGARASDSSNCLTVFNHDSAAARGDVCGDASHSDHEAAAAALYHQLMATAAADVGNGPALAPTDLDFDNDL